MTSRAPASSVVERLTEHATYVLCCIVVLARRKAVAAHMQRSALSSVGSASASLQQQQQRALDSTAGVIFGESGELRRADVERWYKRLMADLRLPQCNQDVVTFALHLLNINGLISSTTTFVCTGDWTLEELEAALVARGTQIMGDHEDGVVAPGSSQAATNKFANVFYRLRLAF
jgi:hypothetical protein